MLLDISTTDSQSYVEDCEVCCNPIQVSFYGSEGKVKGFSAEKAYGWLQVHEGTFVFS